MSRINWHISPECVVTFFCKHCGQPEFKHAEGQCLFDSTCFELESKAAIAKRLCAEKFEKVVNTKETVNVMAAFLIQTSKDLDAWGVE